MPLNDSFSQRYDELLQGGYDCPDRIVLNGYAGWLSSGGGFRCWWRLVFGNDENLDNTHLMRWAARFARRVYASVEKNNIPLIKKQAAERMHELVQKYRPNDPDFTGVFAITVHHAPNSVWEVLTGKNGGIDLQRKRPWVNHYAFHIQDPDWGHITIKVCPHPPFPVTVSLNGHEYLASQANQQNLAYHKEANYFTESTNLAGLERIAETLCSPSAVGRLTEACERWLYSSCLCYLMPLAEQQRVGLRYQWSVYQMEYSRNLLFDLGGDMEKLFQSVIDRTRRLLDVRTIRTLFGNKKRPSLRRDGQPNFEVEVERPTYDLTVFKIHCGLLTLKMYTKGECVLRTEAIVHNVRKEFPRCSIGEFPEIARGLRGMLERFLEVVEGMSSCWIKDEVLSHLPERSRVGNSMVSGVDLNKRRMRAVMEGVLILSCRPDGFRSEHLASQVRELLGTDYTPRQASYDLKKLRGKHWVEKIPGTRRYLAPSAAIREMTAAVVIRDKVLLPLLSSAHVPLTRRPSIPMGRPSPNVQKKLNQHYQLIQYELQQISTLIGLSA